VTVAETVVIVPTASRVPAPRSIEGVDAFYFTEAYFAHGSVRASYWSRLIRIAKDPSASEGGWDSLRRVCDRGVADVQRRIRPFSRVDAVVSVPSRVCRWQRRRMSLPDEFGRVLHDSLGVRYEPDALVSAVDHIEIKRIAIEHRRQVVTGTFAVKTSRLVGKSVLLVDDISTSGATLAECAEQLRNAGVAAVFAYTLGRTADFRSLLSKSSER
jgi:hypothetical protein